MTRASWTWLPERLRLFLRWLLPAATLTAEAMRTGRQRIDLLAKTGSVIAVVQFAFVIIQATQSAISVPNTALFLFSNMVLLVLSLGLAALVRSQLSDTTIWKLGFVWAAIVTIGFSFGTQHLGLVGHGGIGPGAAPCFGIISFSLILPMTPRGALAASLLALPIVPLVTRLTVYVHGAEVSSLDLLRVDYTSLYACLIGFTGARFVFQLSRDAAQARQLGSYTLEARLGEGGMGEVWRARHALLRRPAAVKFIKAAALAEFTPAERQRALGRFEREAQATGRLQSPHSIQLYDFGLDDEGGFYFVMELLEGCDLERLVQRFGPLPPERVAVLLIQICDSLADAHEQGLVHRDIKPANLFLCKRGREVDFAKVLDFGIVGVKTRTSAGSLVDSRDLALGTPAYLAPETVGREPVDGRTDLYSLGAVAFFLLTGRRVFTQQTAATVAAAHLHERPVAPSYVAPQPVPTVLDEVILQCLAKSPADRPPSATAIAERLAASGLPDRWTAERADKWWDEHFKPTQFVNDDEQEHRAPTFLISGSVVALPPHSH